MRRAALLLLAAFATGACGDVAFVADDTLQPRSAAPTDPVALPIQLQWDPGSPDLAAAVEEESRYYVVFVDRAPLAPGGSLGDLVDDDCRSDTGCADQEWFADAGIFVTREPRLVLTTVQDRRTSQRDGAEDRHVATVVVFDEAGVRRGDVALTIPFAIDREAT